MRIQSEWIPACMRSPRRLPLFPTGAHLHEILEYDKAVGAMLRFAEQV